MVGYCETSEFKHPNDVLKKRFYRKCPTAGEILWEVMIDLDITPKDVERIGGIDRESLDKILDGEVGRITPEYSEKLQDVTGVPAYFWLDSERRYRNWRYGKGNRGRN